MFFLYCGCGDGGPGFAGLGRMLFGALGIVGFIAVTCWYAEPLWLLGSILSFGLVVWGMGAGMPLADEEKRAFGKHLPPHLRSTYRT